MTLRFTALGAALFLAACGSTPSQFSNPNADAGVGFGTQQQFVANQQARREKAVMVLQQQVAAEAGAERIGGVQVAAATLATSEEQSIAAETLTALNVAPQGSSVGEEPITALTPVGLASTGDSTGLSDEQNFDAVASRESIESDADRLLRNRNQMQVVQPVAIPERGSASGPNIVAYALATNHPIGTAVHRRGGRTTPERFSRVCQSYGTDDQAQQAFLANGGPERDRKGVDPDGDGYACAWNPQPFRMARGG